MVFFVHIITLLVSLTLCVCNMCDLNRVRITCWNARGYLASIPYNEQLTSECDILAISEQWVYENRLYKLSEISDTHLCFARSSKLAFAEHYSRGRGQGGVALFWDKRLSGISVVSVVILDRACAIRLQTQEGGVLYFVSVYLPAQGSHEALNTSLNELSEVLRDRELGAHVIVMGNFNGDIGRLGGPRGVRDATPRGCEVLGFCNVMV